MLVWLFSCHAPFMSGYQSAGVESRCLFDDKSMAALYCYFDYWFTDKSINGYLFLFINFTYSSKVKFSEHECCFYSLFYI